MSLYKYLYSLCDRPRTVAAALFFALFSASLMIAGILFVFQVFLNLETQLNREIAKVDQLDSAFHTTMVALNSHNSTEACSPEFHHWLSTIAFLPDGIHEILYSDKDQSCSVSRGKIPEGIELGKADLVRRDLGYQFWLDRDLGVIGYPGLQGTFLREGNFLLVLPPLKAQQTWLHGQKQEYVTPTKDGTWLHRGGAASLKDKYPDVQTAQAGFSATDWAFWGFKCDRFNLVCVMVEAPVTGLIVANSQTILVGLVLMLTIVWSLTQAAKTKFLSMMSLPSRFVRTMSEDSLVCHYQPILSLESGEIEGVEVLVRWRDLDGSLVYPDQFLPVVEKRNLSRILTEIVIKNAVSDLKNIPFAVERPRVNINVFPQDFDARWLIKLLMPLQTGTYNFQPVVEIVETSDLPLEQTREAIALLRASGIETYIDDFGVGYSSIHYLSGLGADGVKLDRFFAMAPDDSLSSKLLFSAIEMISKTGQRLVVEGVETKAKMMSLRATNKVHQLQGYGISPPVAVDRLAAFLEEFRYSHDQATAFHPKAISDISAAFK